MKNSYMIEFKDIFDTVGHLTPIESAQDIPFSIERIYYITRVPAEITRGFHAHRNLEQVLICLSGFVRIRIKTPLEEQIVILDDPAKGLYIGHMVWREMFDFSEYAALLVLASNHYDDADYIRDYSQFASEYVIR